MKKRKLLKILIGIFILIALLIICSGIYLKCFLPNIKVKDLKVEVTKERVEKGAYITVMPWTMYAKMDTVDLVAIYNYLKSLPPIENTIVK